MSTIKLTTFQFINIARLLLQAREFFAIMLWGLTGIGKSAIVRQAVQSVSDPGKPWKPSPGVEVSGSLEVINDWGVIDWRVSQLEPSDLRGLPDLGKFVRWAVPDELRVD